MAYVNVRDWSVDQVTDWLKGLDSIILQYTTSFLNNGVTGQQLLNLRSDDLEHLGVRVLGHQEIILEAVEHLRNFHFELDKENLQMLALKLSCISNSLYRELVSVDDDCRVVSIQNLSDVHNITTAIKPLVCWLDRAPFAGDKDYIDCKTQLLELGFEMATSAHRGIFSDKPVCTIRKICEKISKIADHIIQEISDPMILQPASLDLATLRKKEQELGFFILPNNHAIHQIAEIKYGSPAHSSSKIEEGDEIVQVNYQTVVGWQRKNVMILLQDSPPEIVLTLKKRPRHTKVYGQIYMKPYRLPSKKRDNHLYSRWNDNIPSPRLLPINNLPPIRIVKTPLIIEAVDVETETELSNSDSEPPDSPSDGNGRMYQLKPRPILQRRNTITGATPTSKRSFPSVEQYWEVWKNQATSTHSSTYHIDYAKFDGDSNFLRDKSASCNLGIESSPRPTTVIGGLTQNRNNLKTPSFNKDDFKLKKKVNFEEIRKDDDNNNEDNINKVDHLKINNTSSNLNEEKSISVNSLASLTNEDIAFIDEGRELTDRTSMMINNENNDKMNNNPILCDSVLADVKIHDIIKKFDENTTNTIKPKIFPRSQLKKPPDVPQKPDSIIKKIPPAVPPRSATTKIRGKLDKSHSTPAYDLTGDETPLIVESADKPNQESSMFLETKYELGIPVVEAVNLSLVPIITTPEENLENYHEIDEEIKDVPPKPPPRNFGSGGGGVVVEVPKPAYLSDSPKPNLNMDKTIQQKQQIFEFPDPKHDYQTIQISKSNNNESKSKQFEPKLSSTPKLKTDINDDNTTICYKSSNIDIQKNTNDCKISPTNSIVRAMIYSNKNKSGKKKNNSIIAKRRKVTVADLNPPDIEGFLYLRLRSKHNQNVHWEKRWFVLLGNCLYGFKSKEDPRAACLIFLSGFTVAVASEVKSRSNAFKVYHTGTVFYFSAEDQETANLWIEMITAATLHSDSSKLTDNTLYSETDDDNDDDDDNSVDNKNRIIQQEKSNGGGDSLRKFGSLKKFTSSKKIDTTTSTTNHGSTSLDRKWFFNKSSNNTKNSLPVPTAQFRSYRKIKSTNHSPPRSVITGNFTSHIASFAPKTDIPKIQQNVSVPNLTVDNFKDTETQNDNNTNNNNNNNGNNNNKNKLQKPKPLNYIHASNPSLCNISDFHIPSTTRKPLKPCSDNLTGFVTLEELMIKQSEERKLNPYNMAINLNLIKPDVVYGEIPIRPKEKTEIETKSAESTKKSSHTRNISDTQKVIVDKQETSSSSCFGKRLGSLKKLHLKDNEYENRTSTYPKVIGKGFVEQKLNRSLPRTHKIQDSQYLSDRNLSYQETSDEMIYCPETTTDIQFAQNRHLDDRMYKDTPKKINKIKKQHSFSTTDKKSNKSLFEYTKLTNKVTDSTKFKLKSATQYTPMSLPLNQDSKSKPKLAFELNLDDKSTKTSGGGGKLKQIFSTKSDNSHHHHKKEKTFLGSPKLHRAIFRRNTSGNETNWPTTTSTQQQSFTMSQSVYSLESSIQNEPLSINISPHADYPGLEYPPVFEPETYSLADPQSCTLLRKQGKN